MRLITSLCLSSLWTSRAKCWTVWDVFMLDYPIRFILFMLEAKYCFAMLVTHVGIVAENIKFWVFLLVSA